MIKEKEIKEMLVGMEKSEGRCKGETGSSRDLEWMQRSDYKEDRLEVNRACGVSRVTSALAATLSRKKVGVGREAGGGERIQVKVLPGAMRVVAYPFVLSSGHAARITYLVLGDISMLSF